MFSADKNSIFPSPQFPVNASATDDVPHTTQSSLGGTRVQPQATGHSSATEPADKLVVTNKVGDKSEAGTSVGKTPSGLEATDKQDTGRGGDDERVPTSTVDVRNGEGNGALANSDQTSSGNSMIPVAAGGAGAAVVLCLIIVVVVLVFKRHRTRQNKTALTGYISRVRCSFGH